MNLNQRFKIAKSDYLAAMIDKHELLENTPSPRIILCGGSNLAFGVDSEMIEREFGLPVINLGLHAALGSGFIMNELRSSIRENDIVIISFEYTLRLEGSYKYMRNAAHFYPPANKYFKADWIEDIKMNLEKNHDYFKSFVEMKKTFVSPVYSRTAFNAYGDVIGHHKYGHREELHDRGKYGKWDYPGLQELNDLYDYASNMNVGMFFIYPNYPELEYEKNSALVKHLEKQLNDSLEMEIINKPEDMILPDTLFFDTIYHLTKEGCELRTLKMIFAIKNSGAYLMILQRKKKCDQIALKPKS